MGAYSSVLIVGLASDCLSLIAYLYNRCYPFSSETAENASVDGMLDLLKFDVELGKASSSFVTL